MSRSGSRLLEVSQGLAILAPHSDEFALAAEHDIIYAGPSERGGVPKEDQAKLKKLGWFWDTECGSWAYLP